MSTYLPRIRRYWQTYLPEQTASLPDPESFFVNLDKQVAAKVSELADEQMQNQPPTTSFEARQGRRMQAIRTAEEQVLPEMVFLPPEPGTEHLEM